MADAVPQKLNGLKVQRKATMPKFRRTTMGMTFNGHPINTGPNKTPCDKRILRTTERVMNDMLEAHSRILACPFVVRFPQGYEPNGNTEIKKAMAETVKECQRGKPPHKPSYVMVRECSMDGGSHFHGFLMVDNSVVKTPVKTLEMLEKHLDRAVGIAGQDGTGNKGLVELCDKDQNGRPQCCCYTIHRGNETEFNKAFFRASYMAKLKDKDNGHGRELFCSKTNQKTKKEKDL